MRKIRLAALAAFVILIGGCSAMSDIRLWDTAAAANNGAAPDGFPEGMNPGDVNDSAREVMAAVKRSLLEEASRRVVRIQAAGGGTGDNNLTIDGHSNSQPTPWTGGLEGTVALSEVTAGLFVKFTTDGTLNDDAGIDCDAMGNGPHMKPDNNPVFSFRMRTGPDITNSRIWVLASQGNQYDSATPGGSYAGFRYDTVADGTAFWRAVSDDSAAGPTVTATGVAIAADTTYLMSVEISLTQCVFYIDGVKVATHTTNIPVTTKVLAPFVGLRALAAEVKVINFGNAVMIGD